MSIVIKGLSMPKNCLLCPCCVGEGIGAGRQHYCQAIEDEPCVSETYRPKNCPLVEIRAPHGRLIDADADVGSYVETWTCNCSEFGAQRVMAVDDLKYLPTIEAEVSE